MIQNLSNLSNIKMKKSYIGVCLKLSNYKLLNLEYQYELNEIFLIDDPSPGTKMR